MFPGLLLDVKWLGRSKNHPDTTGEGNKKAIWNVKLVFLKLENWVQEMNKMKIDILVMSGGRWHQTLQESWFCFLFQKRSFGSAIKEGLDRKDKAEEYIEAF